MYEITKRDATHVNIKSLATPPSFADTVGEVVVKALDGGPADPKYCVKAPPITTNHGNCTTHVEAFFSDANATLRTAPMQSCGILTWLPVNPDGGGHAYGQWAHANEPTPMAPSAGAMCDFQPGMNLYKLVGTNFPDVRYATIENVKDAQGHVSQTQVRLRSVNRTWPDTTATVSECIEGKIAWRATLAGKTGGAPTPYRGIMRANSHGGLNCCQQDTDPRTGVTRLVDCPVLSWWSPTGAHECWAPVNVPSEPLGGCGE